MKEQLELHHIDKRLSKGVKVLLNQGNDWAKEYIDRAYEPLNIYSIDSEAEGKHEIDIGHSYNQTISTFFSNIKPILHPLTDLTKEITIKGETFVPLVRIQEEMKYYQAVKYRCTNDFGIFLYLDAAYELGVDLKAYEYLLEWNFDVDGLIEKGLAIDVNTLNENPYE